MDIGRLKLRLGRFFVGTVEDSMPALHLAVTNIGDDLATLPGIASIEAAAVLVAAKAVAIVNGKLVYANAATAIPAIGISIAGAQIGQKARIVLGCGFASALSGLTANTSVYLGNAGALLFAKPATGFIQGLGYAVSATEMFVTISQP